MLKFLKQLDTRIPNVIIRVDICIERKQRRKKLSLTLLYYCRGLRPMKALSFDFQSSTSYSMGGRLLLNILAGDYFPLTFEPDFFTALK